MVKWEYIRLQVATDQVTDIDAQVSQLGLQGWELVAVTDARGHGVMRYLHLWFKRSVGGERGQS